jgi:hypothetical protein
MQRANQPTMDQQFFSRQNEGQLIANISNSIQQQLGGAITQPDQTRIVKTIKHYMQEVWDVNGPMPIQQLNREVLSATSSDFSGYLRRKALGGSSQKASQRIVSENQPQAEMAQQRLLGVQPRPTFENTLLMDTGSRYEQVQQERTSGGTTRPPVPKFDIAVTSNGDEPSALTLYEAAKKNREEEASRAKPIGGSDSISGTGEDVNPLARFMSPPSLLNDAQANPTISLPVLTPVPRGPLPQDYLIKQDDVINYRETEHNLFLYSGDRDWMNSSGQSRYNYTVNFDVGNNNRQGFTSAPSSTRKFKNIVRIELVKAIMPTEGINTIVQYSGSAFNTNPKLNILSYPYVVVRIPELDGNNYGTDNNLDNAFGVLQYDANWYTDTTNLTDGFLGMIPKFLKCQKVYAPTPLATLTKLSVQLQLPNGNLVSDTADTLTIQSIFFGDKVAAATVYAGNYATANYIIIQTTTWFSQWAFTEGNTIQLGGIDPTQVNTYSTVAAAAQDLATWLMLSNGYVIVGIGNTNNKLDGPNAVGYGNLIILRNRFADPTTGSVSLLPFGGAASNASLGTALYNSSGPSTTVFTGAKLINLTHQTNVVFRVITREMDPAARVRPDNL